MIAADEMRFPFSTKQEIQGWAKRYTEDQTGAQKLVEKYLIGLKKTVRERKTRRTPNGYLRYNELYDLVYWKLKRSRWINKNPDYSVTHVTRQAFHLDDDSEKLNKLTDLYGVGQSVASAILHFCDQKEYPILDQHSLRSLTIDEEYIYGPEYSFWQEYVNFCRTEAKRYNVSMRTLDRALWKFSEVGSIWENETLRRHRYPRARSSLAVTMPDGKQFRCRTGVDTFVAVIKEMEVEKVKRLNIKLGRFLVIDDAYHDGVKQVKSGPYYIRVPGNINRQADLLKEIAKRLNLDLIVDYFYFPNDRIPSQITATLRD